MEPASSPGGSGLVDRLVSISLDNTPVVLLLTAVIVIGGLVVVPFDFDLGSLPRHPVPADAIPDYGENQQIIFTPWQGRSPRDVEDQITYPLSSALLGVAGVRTVRATSAFGFSSVHVIFHDGVDFHWSRARLLEKISSLPEDLLPDGVLPTLGPDATGTGQVFWYTLEGLDQSGEPVGGWDLEELRSIQDFQVRIALMAVEGVSEVASIGGFVKELQVDVDPSLLRLHGLSLEDVQRAISLSNRDSGARTIEINQVEYVVRALGRIESLDDLREVVLKTIEGVSITIGEVAEVSFGPAPRRGVLDDAGSETVGGVVVVRHGEDPLETINRVRARIEEIAPSLGQRVLEDGTTSQVTLTPFYDRSVLIRETLDTLKTALTSQMLVTVLVVVLLLGDLASSLLISGTLPLVVLLSFLVMKVTGVQANVVALAGIAIAIGTLVDVAIVISESVARRLKEAREGESPVQSVRAACSEVAGPVVTSIFTTVISFLPVLTLTAAEGKMFRPLALTKTYALVASLLIGLSVLPALALLLARSRARGSRRHVAVLSAIVVVVVLFIAGEKLAGSLVMLSAIFRVFSTEIADWLPSRLKSISDRLPALTLGFTVVILLAGHWQPLGPVASFLANTLMTLILIVPPMVCLMLLGRYYERMLRTCLDYRRIFLGGVTLVVVMGVTVWLGFNTVFGSIPRTLGVEQRTLDEFGPWQSLSRSFPGLGREFLPRFDEGAFLYMPSTLPHASIGEALDQLQQQDRAIAAVPEVSRVVGKIGRVESALDPAPLSMMETVIHYKSEFMIGPSGDLLRFRWDEENGSFARSPAGDLIPDGEGRPYRQWRDDIRSPVDIWARIEEAARVPGATGAPLLQPIETRLIMLQTGMRSPLGVKVYGDDLASIERVALDIERLLREVPGVKPATVRADRVVGKPYLEIDLDRRAMARYGVTVDLLGRLIEAAVGGDPVTRVIDGRERYAVRVRYPRERRLDFDAIGQVLVPTPSGAQVPLRELSRLQIVAGPSKIQSENARLLAYVTFDKESQIAEIDFVERAREYLQSSEQSGALQMPEGVTYRFAGTWENQLHAQQRMLLVLPLCLLAILALIWMRFRALAPTLFVFSGVFVAWSGGFLLLGLFGVSGFLDFDLLGVNLADLFQVHPVHLSIAVWVGFLALFGIATDDGVLMATFLDRSVRERNPTSPQEVREAVVAGAIRRIRPCLMTSATTIIALLPVITSTGKGSDVMVPMALPSFGGMIVVVLTVFLVPVLWSIREERNLPRATA
ncbi:MAG TPA: efflux RND transporter permease subunit [Planctomycetes bacterium]|nr:efflux RND transporter permease subunit [Planctomycetota bacterium]HIN80543.1 efflux RND transporter permease subunit [Planctomycetota bacterium]